MDEKKQKEYEAYVKRKTPVHCLWKNMLKAFLTGGIICSVGQWILNYCKSMGVAESQASAWCSLLLVLISVILTGLNIYPKIAKWGGAGALVPITGFANSMASSALESKSEGLILGIITNVFKLAGSVIVVGILCGIIIGVFRYLVGI